MAATWMVSLDRQVGLVLGEAVDLDRVVETLTRDHDRTAVATESYGTCQTVR